ncbi:MAG: MarR family transcriptional regulator [Nanoarchaeota archaeon]|nr:winged helix-turn-helix transcriptional regulator [Nanoarchaeota archaeon]MBU1029753.1 winged helix-turn-helix transcriptional regulator [Nanoarchaeota archaeon]
MSVKKKVIYSFVLLCIITSVLAIEPDYYADIKIDVSKDGLVMIEGNTNHPSLLTQDNPDYTSKNGRYWVLNISFQEVFSDAIFILHLPKNANINYLKIPRTGRIEQTKKGILIIGTLKNQSLSIIVQYQLMPVLRVNILPVCIILFLLLAIIFLIYSKIKRKFFLSEKTKSMTDRQKLIFKLVIKNKGRITQRELELKTKLPKSSLSRNVDSLERKGFITKENNGMTNIIHLKQQ